MHRLELRRPAAVGRSSGFSILETTVGMAILMIGLMAMSSTSFVVHSLGESDKAQRAANGALRAVIEEVNALSNVSKDADGGWGEAMIAAYGADGAPGPTFAVPTLEPWEGLAQVGSIWVVTDETLSDTEIGAELGMPRDLDGDGLVSNEDVSGDANLLPVIVRMRWSGESGNREMIHGFYVLGF